MKILKIASELPKTGLISPEGKFFDLGNHSYHYLLAMDIVKKDPELLQAYKEAREKNENEDYLSFLLKNNWIRVIGNSAHSAIPTIVLEFNNLELAQKIISQLFSTSGYKVFADYNHHWREHFNGRVEDFLNWGGKPKQYISPYKVGKKASASGSGFIAPSGAFYPFGNFESHWDLAKSLLAGKDSLKPEDKKAFESYVPTQGNTDIVEHLLKNGWIRVAVNEGRIPLNFEFNSNFDHAKKLIGDLYKNFFGVMFVQYQDATMHGKIENFQNWNGLTAYVSPFQNFRGGKLTKSNPKQLSEESMKSLITRISTLRKADASSPSKSGWVSPTGEYYPSERPWSFSGIHNALAKKIIKSDAFKDNPDFQEFINSGEIDDIADNETASNFLLKQGWTRLIGTEVDKGVIQIESIANLDSFKNFLKSKFPSFFGDVIAQYQGDFFTGDVDDFMKWDGSSKKPRSLYDRFGKKKKADFNSLTRNIDTLIGPATHTLPMEYGDEEVQYIYPGQKEKISPRHESGEEDEFVHTHPTNGAPRYDLRKLKIVDESDSES